MIELDDKFFIESESTNWTLTERREGKLNKETGNTPVSTRSSYHATLKQALNAYTDQSLHGSASAQEILDRLNQVEEKICLVLS